MSFILEALTQSEEERHRGKVPDTPSPPTSSIEAPARTPRWPYVLSIALALSLTAALAWLTIAWKSGEEPANMARTGTPVSRGVEETPKLTEPGCGGDTATVVAHL